jgi:DNA-binding cell septation regulator SpoVG
MTAKSPSQAELRTGAAVAFGGKPQPQAKISRFREYRNPAGTMLAFFSAELPSGLLVHQLKLMVGPRGRRFVGMPDNKRRDQDDRLVRDRDARDRFAALILAALRVERPELFVGEPSP